jgi:hypothetical protein
MAQTAFADKPIHQGLFNLAKSTGGLVALSTSTSTPTPTPSAAPLAAPALAPAPIARLVPVNAPTPNLAPKAALPAPVGATQVQPKPIAVARREPEVAAPVSRGRYLKSLEHMAKTEESKAIVEIVARVRPREVEHTVLLTARARARYLACVVDLGANRTPISRGNIEELAALRKAHEEMSKGLDALTGAIREGLVDIVGVGD